MKKYRIKKTLEDGYTVPAYIVQVRKLFRWVDIKMYYDPWYPDFARREAEELLDKLNER